MSVSITLQFDSVEAARDALRRLTDGEVAEPAPKTTKPSAKEKADAAVAKVNETNRKAAAAKKAEKADKTDDGATYADVKVLVHQLSAIDRDEAVAIAEEMGLKTFRDLEPEQYSEAIDKLKAKIAELED